MHNHKAQLIYYLSTNNRIVSPLGAYFSAYSGGFVLVLSDGRLKCDERFLEAAAELSGIASKISHGAKSIKFPSGGILIFDSTTKPIDNFRGLRCEVVIYDEYM